MIANCASCKHYDEATDPRGWCLLKKELTHWQRELTCHEPRTPEPPEPMRQYPPTSEPVAAVVVYGYGSPILKCGACGSWYMDAKVCLTCGRAWVMP